MHHSDVDPVYRSNIAVLIQVVNETGAVLPNALLLDTGPTIRLGSLALRGTLTATFTLQDANQPSLSTTLTVPFFESCAETSGACTVDEGLSPHPSLRSEPGALQSPAQSA